VDGSLTNSAKITHYEYEIGYSQSVILAEFIFGVLMLFGSVISLLMTKSLMPIFFMLIGAFLIWKATTRFGKQGPQLKIGKQGIWTVETGALPWRRVTLRIEHHMGYRGGVSSSLVIINRLNPNIQMPHFYTSELDIDYYDLQMILRKFT
jgi:hypothetical protein